MKLCYCLCLIIFLAIIVWFIKIAIFQDVQTTLLLKASIVLIIVVTSLMFCNKASIIQEIITPLVCLFGIWFILSVPLFVYHMWDEQAYNDVSSKLVRTSSLKTSKPNIILVTFDALTARNMSVYGYHRETTPFISHCIR